MPFPQHTMTVTGNTAASHVAYALSDLSTLFPITPSSPMGATVDAWAVQGRKNCFGQVLEVQQMQSEAGAAAALHGAASVGSLGTTFTAAQGLLLMVPDMFRIAGSLYPSVIHVAARAIAGQGWSIMGDQCDIMSVRHTGWAMLSSHNGQQIHDNAIVAHLASIKSRIPFVHFFEGFQLSHEVSKIITLTYDELNTLIPMDKVYEHRARALSPNHPTIRGTVQPVDYYMQSTEANQRFYAVLADIVEETMNEVAEATGRPLHLFDYFGDPNAERVIVIMGACADVAAEAVEYLNAHDPSLKAGVIAVHLFRPWSLKHFIKMVPKTVKRMAVLDRSIESGAQAEPLFLDVVMSLFEGGRRDIDVVGGRYGLGGKIVTPMDMKAVLDNLLLPTPKNHFIVNVIDDVLHSNLPIPTDAFSSVPPGTTEAVFWGMGGDGTVSANIEAISIIGVNTDLFAQGQFEYDSHKSGGVTKSHLRFGPHQFKSHYPIDQASYVACHHPMFVFKFNVLGKLAPGGVFVYNTSHTSLASLESYIPGSMKRALAEKQARLYVIDAGKLAREVGLGNKTSMILQTVFFALSGVLPLDQLLPLLKESIVKAYGKKGANIVEMNMRAVDQALSALMQIDYPRDAWLAAEVERKFVLRFDDDAPDFVRDVMEPVALMEGDSLPISALEPGGVYAATATSKYEKRGIAPSCPTWLPDQCTQCNYCSLMCPHSCIRPFLLNDEEVDGCDGELPTLAAKGASGYQYRIQVSPYDCTGCEVCVNVCPTDALRMVPFEESAAFESPRWDYIIEHVPNRGSLFDKTTVKGSQFQQPLLEFPGACAGCGETQYVKLMTQLYGDRILMSSPAGCCVVWAGSFPTAAYSRDANGRGPAYGFSLFEDAAEYGYGMALANRQAQARVKSRMEGALAEGTGSDELRTLFKEWLECFGSADRMQRLADQMIPLLEAEKGNHADLRDIYEHRDVLHKISHWVVGGDGWAYDIGFGGLDHVVSSGENINIIILDNEVYSNTGGQKSKATPMGAVAKFAAKGKMTHKKDLGIMLMSKGDVYVASVAVGANYVQTLKALLEAEAYPGPSVIIAYSPCIEHGVRNGLGDLQEETRMAVDSGYWNLFRYNPALREKGQNPFQLDSPRLREDLSEFLKRENRFLAVHRVDRALGERFSESLRVRTQERFASLRQMAEGPAEASAASVPDVTVLYVSETGTAEGVARRIAEEAGRRSVSARCVDADAVSIDDLCKQKFVVVVASTCGQGAIPANGKSLWNDLSNADLNAELLSGVKYAVFGLGDSSYVFFNKVATDLDARLAALGATRVLGCGMGDDLADDKYETAFEEWEADMWHQLGAAEPTDAPPAARYAVEVVDAPSSDAMYVPDGFSTLRLVRNELLTPPDHDRDIRHYEFSTDLRYALGDSLAIHPHNNGAAVADFLSAYGLDADQVVEIKPLVDGPLSLRKLFTEVLDVFGRPSRVFLKSLVHFATDESEAAAIKNLLKAGFKAEVTDKMLSYADLLLKYASARPSLDVLVSLIPAIKPRYYSIASSHRADPSRLELCIVLVDWTVGDGEARTGLCTGFLRALAPGAVVACAVRPSTVAVPKDDRVPVIMAGLGTGMAPYRALVQDRAWLREQGEPAGQLTLYYGCRYEKKEFLYGDYLRSMAAKGVLRLRPAFSRDQAHKVYVTDRIREDAAHVHHELVEAAGTFLFCGPAGRQPEDVREAVASALAESDPELSVAAAEELIVEWKVAGRYGQETW